MDDQLSMIDAMERRDEVLADVVEHNKEWMAGAITKFHELKHLLPDDFIGEQIRDLLIRRGGIPHKAPAWGALINTLQRGKQIVRTGEYRKMLSADAHARESRVYRLAAVMEPA